MIGIDPSPFTLRELAWMRDGRQRETWEHTSHILVTLANVNRDPRTPPHRFEDVYPFTERKNVQPTEGDIDIIRQLWLGVVQGRQGEQ